MEHSLLPLSLGSILSFECVYFLRAFDDTEFDSQDAPPVHMKLSAAELGSHVSTLADSARTHELYFDDECRRMKREVKQAWQAGADRGKTKELERSYHNLVRAKKRRHMKNTLRELLSERVKDPRKFWKKLRHHPTHLPPQLHSVLTWRSYMQNLTNPVLPPNCHLPNDAYPTKSTSLAVCLNVPIQTQEVQDHLSRLHNGKTAGRLGLHSELLRYACKRPTQDEPKPVHKLIVPLTALFNAFFAEGFIPASLNHALITPVYKKGSRTDTRIGLSQ